MTKEFPWFDEIRMCHMANIEVTQLQVCQHTAGAWPTVLLTQLFPEPDCSQMTIIKIYSYCFIHIYGMVSCILFRIQLLVKKIYLQKS